MSDQEKGALNGERAAFEKWAKRTHTRPGAHFDQSHNGVYKDNRIAAKWAAWQARAALDDSSAAKHEAQFADEWRERALKAEGELRVMRAAFHCNMLRAFPSKSHAEISDEIDKVLDHKQPATGVTP